jgi:hypothetical protein
LNPTCRERRHVASAPPRLPPREEAASQSLCDCHHPRSAHGQPIEPLGREQLHEGDRLGRRERRRLLAVRLAARLARRLADPPQPPRAQAAAAARTIRQRQYARKVELAGDEASSTQPPADAAP